MHKKRLQIFALLGVLGGLGLTACGEKNEDANAPAGGGGDKEVATKVADPVAPEPAPAGDLDAVAKATGFAQYLPNTTHAYVGIYDGKGFVDGIRKSALVKLIEEQIKENGDPDFDLDALEQNEQAAIAISLLGEEIFVGVGKGSPEQLSNLVALNESTTRHWMRFMMKMLDMRLSGEEPNFEGGPGEMMMPLIAGILGDPNAGIPSLEKAQVPPVTIGFKVSDEEMRGQLYEFAADGLGQILEEIGPDGEGFAEAINVERAGSKFTGVKIIGKKLVAAMPDEAKEGMSQFMDAATVEKLIKILETKNVVIAVGVHQNYLVGFAGSALDDLQIAASPAESMLARPEASFMKSYADKKLLGLFTVSKELQDSVSKKTTLFGSLALGLKEGLAETKGFGDTRDIEVLLGLIAEQERELFNMNSYTPAGVVAFLEDGLKIESYGGSNMPDADLDTPRRYAGLGKGEDVFLFANWVSDRDYSEKALEYIDSIGETIYLGAKHAAKMEVPDGGGDFESYKENFAMFDEKMRPLLLELWTGLRGDLVGGLGNEGAIVVDLKGELPTVPGLPQLVVDEGKAPRIALLSPAVDAEKLAASWKKIDHSMNGLLKIVSEKSGKNIPMQKPMTSEKNDLKTWFFPFPFQTDDFVLNVSVDQKNFYASTSKSYVQILSAKLEKAEVDPTAKGVYFNMDLTVLNKYVSEWFTLLEENKDKIFGEESPAAEDFMESLPIAKKVLVALGELKGISGHTRKEDGEVRTSMHFKTGK